MPNGELQVLAIESLLRDALRNLIENAVKHTTDGVCITVSIRSNGVVTVTDDERIRQRKAVEPATQSNTKGIGLEIVKRIAELHGAHFQLVRSEHGTRAKGTVTLTWPRTEFDLYALFQAACGHVISRHTLAAAWRRSR
ncbi:ATP-binding protein (plasmid) [Phyllobacterium sp. 628]|uniref:sensor histidine kinase n=1 Tax=Phyllobacterium sp. 628 TaxID=2718938 RepID=UPI0016625C4A|nr:ATP-binding protein [Phyllobacterium sp. 628]